jgi:hypothetical protein
MDKRLQTRRDEWLKLSTEDWDGICDLYGPRMNAEIEKYAELKLSQSRLRDLDAETDRRFPKWANFLVWAFLTAIGVTIFTVLPNIILGKQGASDSFIVVGRSIFGVFLAFIAHFAISSFIAGMLLRNQHLAVLKQLKDEINTASVQKLKSLFINSQIVELQRTEKSHAKFPSIFVVLPTVIFTLAEIVALFVILTRDDSSLNPVILFIATLLPACLLWGVAYVTAYYQKVPYQNNTLKGMYLQKMNEIERIYEQPQDTTANGDESNHNNRLAKMENLLFNEMEEEERTIDYVLECHRRKEKRSNALIQLDGQRRYYKEVLQLIKNEASKLERQIDESKYVDLTDDDSRQLSVTPDGEGHTPYKSQIYDNKLLEEYGYISEFIDKRVAFLVSECEGIIQELDKKYNDEKGSHSIEQ